MDNRTSLATTLDYAHKSLTYTHTTTLFLLVKKEGAIDSERRKIHFLPLQFCSYLDQILKFVQIENKERYKNDVLDHNVDDGTLCKANE